MSETVTKPPAEVAARATDRTSGTGRLVGLDVARGLAVIGMFAAHAGATQSGGWVHTLVSGRSAALFAVLAGVSLALMSGGARSADVSAHGRDWTVARIVVRGIVLFLLGLALTSLQVPAMVILTTYGVLFLLSIPLLRMRSSVLAALAGGFAVAGPVVSFALRSQMSTPDVLGYTPKLADFTSLDGTVTAVQGILLTGAYPVLTWIPFLLLGLALGRLDLRVIRVRLIGIGAALALVGYGVSWLAMNVWGGFDRIMAQFGDQLPPEIVRLALESSYGTVPATDPVYLLGAGAHSGTPFEIVGAGGVAMAVLGACLLVDRFPVVRPLASVGALALTVYVGHLLVLRAVGEENLNRVIAESPYLPWLVLVLTTVVVTTVWRMLLGRGPLEYLLKHISTAPERILAHGRSRGASSS